MGGSRGHQRIPRSRKSKSRLHATGNSNGRNRTPLRQRALHPSIWKRSVGYRPEANAADKHASNALRDHMMYAGETRHPISRGSMVIAAFSTIVEWYDFTLYLYFTTVLSRVFFGGGNASLLITLGGFAVAYLMRPLGALFFGHVGDRYGRRKTLLLSVAVMTAVTLATALLPTRTEIGPAAGWILIALRCVMGFAVGGECTGVIAYLLEG